MLVLISVTLSLLGASTVPSGADVLMPPECSSIPGLAKAPELDSDLTPSGVKVDETPLIDGSHVPVVMIHGWTGRGAHSEARDGAFSSRIDLTANKQASTPIERSMIGQTQDIPGTAVYTFDYHNTSARWVNDPSIAPALAKALTCLATAHGHAVIVVGHSMGGLATRAAFDLIAADPAMGPPNEYVSDVITFGTPNTGSWLAAVASRTIDVGAAFPGASGSAVVALKSLLTACGTLTTSSLDAETACSGMDDALSSFDSQAGRALRMGSPEIKALTSWPDDVTVHALAGDIGLEFLNVSWFGVTREAGRINTGDFIVRTDSATANSNPTASVTCEYTLNAGTATADNLLQAFQLRSANETRDNVYTNLNSSACFHGNLMRSIELTNAELAIVAERLDEVAKSPFFVGQTEFVRLEPWQTTAADGPITQTKDLGRSCYQAAGYRADYFRCAAGEMCFTSPDDTEALCGGSVTRLARVHALNVAEARDSDRSYEEEYTPVGRIQPIEIETVTGQICSTRWTGTGFFGPPPFGPVAAYCTSVEDRQGDMSLVLWGSEIGPPAPYGKYFSAPEDSGYLRSPVSAASDLDMYMNDNNSQYDGPYEFVDIIAVYY